MKSRIPALLWIVVLALWILAGGKNAMNLEHILVSPHFSLSPFEFSLGTDAFGRNLASALAEAMGRSLAFALVSTIAALTIGILFGGALGMMKGNVRFFFDRILDFCLAFPAILLALAIQAAVGTGWTALGFAVSFGLFPSVVRFISARAKEIAVKEYIVSAEALGGTKASIFWRHYRPELFDHLRLKFPSLVAQALLLEATLSFLNLGVSPGVLSWGSLLGQAKDYMIEAPHIACCVGIPLVLTLLALQSWVDRPKGEPKF